MERLNVDIRPSRFFCCLCLGVHAAAIAALLAAPLPILLAMSVGLALAVSAVFYLRRFGLLVDDDSVVALNWQAPGWYLILGDGRRLQAHIKGPIVLTRRLVVVNFKTDGGRYSVALLPDSTAVESFRRLRVLLNLSGRISRN